MPRNLCRALLLVVFGGLALTGCKTIPDATLAQTTPYQGTYVGGATINDPGLPGNVCPSQIPFSGFTVSGDQVHFGQFNGPIREDGSVNLVAGQSFLTGRFMPPVTFVGQLMIPPNNICIYRVELRLPS